MTKVLNLIEYTKHHKKAGRFKLPALSFNPDNQPY